MKTTPLFYGNEGGLFDYVEVGAEVPRTRMRKRGAEKTKPDPEFGRRIRRVRMAAGLIQEDFARMCGVHQITLSRYETASIGVPPARRKAIEEVLNKLEEQS